MSSSSLSMSSSSSQPQMAAAHNNNNNDSSKLTRLDRSLSVIIENPDQTPSRDAGIGASLERLHRWHGTSVLFESSIGLGLGPSTCATACTIFHRFYHSCSLKEYDVWSVALASTLLATKVEEDPKSLQQIIQEYNRIYAKRIVLAEAYHQIDDDERKSATTTTRSISCTSSTETTTRNTKNNNGNEEQSTTTTRDLVLSSKHLACLENVLSKWPDAKKRQAICLRLPQQLSKHGPVYKEWHREISRMESVLLRQLGFTFYWIPDSHPHKFLFDFCRVLELDENKEFTQRAWDYCNDSCRLDLSVRYPPEVIASSAIFLAARDFDIALPMKPLPWWKVFLGNENDNIRIGKDLVDVTNAILGTCSLQHGRGLLEQQQDTEADDSKRDDDATDWLVATKGFLCSMVTDGEIKAFNNSGSFLWFYHKEFFDKEIENE